jgi:iron complex transport system ATP-binding protein
MENVSLTREGNQIITEVDWQIEKGEHWALIGLNGAGKTTLLNILNGYLWPTTGKVSVLGQRFGKTDLRELRKAIGWVSSALQERIKISAIAEDIVMSGKFSSIGLYEETSEADRNQALEIMRKLDIPQLEGRKYHTCSQGEQQRILIGRALMAQPELLILDEPTNGLDFIARESLLRTVQQLMTTDNAPTIVFVTHHTQEILPEFTHTFLLREGKNFAQGKTKEILRNDLLTEFFGQTAHVYWQNNRPHLFQGSAPSTSK